MPWLRRAKACYSLTQISRTLCANIASALLDRGRPSSASPTVITCASDDEAKDKAKDFIGSLDVELLDDHRMLVWYPRK